MSDARLRELQLRCERTGSREDEAAFLRERLRTGDLAEASLTAPGAGARGETLRAGSRRGPLPGPRRARGLGVESVELLLGGVGALPKRESEPEPQSGHRAEHCDLADDFGRAGAGFEGQGQEERDERAEAEQEVADEPRLPNQLGGVLPAVALDGSRAVAALQEAAVFAPGERVLDGALQGGLGHDERARGVAAGAAAVVGQTLGVMPGQALGAALAGAAAAQVVVAVMRHACKSC